MKGFNKILAIPGMFLLVIVLLITSFQIVIYGDPSYKFYEKEYEKYQVTASLHMSMEDVMEVTDHMMDYLIGKEENLSIVTNVDGCCLLYTSVQGTLCGKKEEMEKVWKILEP